MEREHATSQPPRIELDAGLHHAFEASADRVPEAVAVLDERQALTYRQLDERANALAARLAALGVGLADPVGIHLDQSAEFAVALLGVLKAGAACLPLDPAYPAERLSWMAEDAAAQCVITATPAALDGLVPAIVDIAGADLATGQVIRPGTMIDPESPAYVIYTSGSTGRPKGVLVPHRGLVNHQWASVGLYGLVPEDVVLHLGSIGFDISIEAIFPTWAAGARVVFRPQEAPLSGSGFIADLVRLGVSVLDLPTAFWHQWVRDLATIQGEVPPSIRAVIVGGERASATALAVWRQRGGAASRWFNTYGPTEASVIATAWEPPPSMVEVPEDLPIGRPIEGVRLHLLGPDGEPVQGGPGEIYIAGAGVAIGYLNRPELNAERFVPDPDLPGAIMYRTGDLAQWYDGQLYFRGRVDDQVKIRGFRVEPGEVEAAIVAQPGVYQAAVVARPGPGGEPRLLAYVVARTGATLDVDDILRLLPERLPLHLVPAVVKVLEALPLTPNGKVDKAALPDVTMTPRRLAQPVEEIRDGIDRALVDIWEEVLGVAPVGIDDDFFQLGGHSLGAVRMIGMIEWLMSVEVPMRTLLEQPTVRHMADAIRSGNLEAEGGLVQTLATGTPGVPPLIYICTVETGVVALRHVLPFLDPGQPVHTFVLRRTAGMPDVHSIPKLAEVGLAEVYRKWPSPTYRVVGYSIGGLVAYDMAQRMKAAGSEVEVLGLLDTWAPGAVPASAPGAAAPMTLRHALGLARREAKLLAKDPHLFAGHASKAAQLAVGRSRRLARRLASRADATLAAGRGGATQTPGLTPPLPEVQAGVNGAVAQVEPAPGELLLDDGSLSSIYDSYPAAPYHGRVVLLSTKTSVNRYGGLFLGWSPPDPSTWQCKLVPGEHGNLMLRDNAPAVGRELAAAIAAASRPGQHDKGDGATSG